MITGSAELFYDDDVDKKLCNKIVFRDLRGEEAILIIEKFEAPTCSYVKPRGDKASFNSGLKKVQ